MVYVHCGSPALRRTTRQYLSIEVQPVQSSKPSGARNPLKDLGYLLLAFHESISGCHLNNPTQTHPRFQPATLTKRISNVAMLAANGSNEFFDFSALDRRGALKTVTLLGGAALAYGVQRAMNGVPPYLQLYRRNLDVVGDRLWAAQNWASRKGQLARFAVLADAINCSGQSVLDVGCGQGDFAQYLVSRGEVPCLLHGIDGISEFVTEARRTAPSWAEYEVGDPVADSSVLGSGWDWVVLSGVIVNMAPSQAKRLLADCWRTARRGIAFNFLSANVFLENVAWLGAPTPRVRQDGSGAVTLEERNSELHLYAPEELVRWAREAGAEEVRLVQDYLGGEDVTIVMLHDASNKQAL